MENKITGQLDEFLDGLLAKAHPSTLPKPLLDKMKADLTIQLEQRVHDAVLVLLATPDEQAEYQTLVLNEVPNEELQTWLEGHIDGLPEVMTGVFKNFATEYLSVCLQ